MTPMRTGLLAAGVLLGLLSAAAATDLPAPPARPAAGPPLTLTAAQLDAIVAGGCVGCPPPRNPFPDNAMAVVGGGGVGVDPSVYGGNGMAGGNPVED